MAGVKGRSDRSATALDGTVISLIRQRYLTQQVVVNVLSDPSGMLSLPLRDVVATPPGCCRYPSGMLSLPLRDVVVKPYSVSVGCRGERSDTRHATPDTAPTPAACAARPRSLPALGSALRLGGGPSGKGSSSSCHAALNGSVGRLRKPEGRKEAL